MQLLHLKLTRFQQESWVAEIGCVDVVVHWISPQQKVISVVLKPNPRPPSSLDLGHGEVPKNVDDVDGQND